MICVMKREPAVDIGRLNEMMAQRRWGPGELALYSGVVYDTIYKIRKGSQVHTYADILAKLAQALGCSLDYLVGLTDDPTPHANAELSPLHRQLLMGIARLSPRRQQDLFFIARGFLEADDPKTGTIDLQSQLVWLTERMGGDELRHQLVVWLRQMRPDDESPDALPPDDLPDDEDDG